jgi:hypothetical protein
VVASPPTISDYGACSGAVGPDADDCEAGGSDRDCDGIKGNGAACTVNVLVYVSNTGSLACGTPSADWPTDIMLIDENDPAGVPNGYTLITQFKAFRTGSATKRAIHRCATATEPYHSVGYGACTASIEDHLLGYVSIVNGGNGWVQLAEVNGKDFGPIGTMRSDVPQCCSTNCFATTNYVLK